MEEKKGYSVKQLATILGCSVTAVQKKILPDENNPEIKRYKKRFEVVINDGKTMILLTDSELETEKRLSKGFNNVNTTEYTTPENVIDIEPEPQKQAVTENTLDKFIEFTNVHIQRYETLQQTYYNDILQRDKQILLLTTSENKKETEYLAAQAKTKQLEKRNVISNVSNNVINHFYNVIYFALTVINLKSLKAIKNPLIIISTGLMSCCNT